MYKFLRIFNTVKYLKFIQIYFRLFYFIRDRFRRIRKFEYKLSKNSESIPLKFLDSCEYYSTYKDGEFHMLNLSKKFTNEIDWNFSKYGKLWTYNLTYFEYLKEKEDVSLIYNFLENIKSVKDGLEPFPISLRGINWIKFLTRHQIRDNKIDNSLYAQYYILLDNLEYHLLGNHLLENGFSLLFGSYYFQDEVLYQKAKKILLKELDEQILKDGGHFELSPMYHQLMLFRLLDCINLVQNNHWKSQELLSYLSLKASQMLGWLKKMTYESGEIPLFNDSAKNIAPMSSQLFQYAKRLKCDETLKELSDSGYRKVKRSNYECVIDIGEVGASYIAGHAHADTFNFELQINKKPFIVDTGVSTYNIGKTRDSERSTKAHNTVEIEDTNSSEVWAGFRVANRANVFDIVKENDFYQATHNGYSLKKGILHTRSWKFEENRIIIEDSLNQESRAVARLHFHPSLSLDLIKNHLIINNKFRVKSYNFTEQFNKWQNAICIEIDFSKNLTIEIVTKGYK